MLWDISSLLDYLNFVPLLISTPTFYRQILYFYFHYIYLKTETTLHIWYFVKVEYTLNDIDFIVCEIRK